MPGPPLTPTDVAQRLRAFEEEDQGCGVFKLIIGVMTPIPRAGGSEWRPRFGSCNSGWDLERAIASRDRENRRSASIPDRAQLAAGPHCRWRSLHPLDAQGRYQDRHGRDRRLPLSPSSAVALGRRGGYAAASCSGIEWRPMRTDTSLRRDSRLNAYAGMRIA